MAKLTLEQIYELSFEALRRCGANDFQAGPTAQSVKDAEAEGIRNVGLGYLPIYLGHLRSGKVIGDAQPSIKSQEGAVLQVDVAHGFCHPAFIYALYQFVELTNKMGIAVMSLQRSYSAGVVGWFNDILARKGLVSLAFANAPTSVAPYGGKTPFFGTNPISFGAPRADGDPIIVDMATSATAKVNIKKAAAEGREIPLGWAIDPAGNPTSDPKLGLKGGLAPLGGAKGFGLGLMVELLAAGMTGGNWAHETPAFGDNIGGPPNVGQIFIALAPNKMGGTTYLTRLEGMISHLLAIDGVRLPGARRHEARATAAKGIKVPEELLAKIAAG